MTRERLEELWPAMEAFKAGAKIRFRHRRGDYPPEAWRVTDQPTWSDNVDYEVIPEPREVWINIYPDGTLGDRHKTQEEALLYRSNPNVRPVRFVEVAE